MTIEWKPRPSRAADNTWYIDMFVDGEEMKEYIKVTFVVDTHSSDDISGSSAAELYTDDMPNVEVAGVYVIDLRREDYTRCYTINEAKTAIIQHLVEGQLDASN